MHLNQKREKYLDEAVEAVTRIIYCDGLLRLAIPYEFLVKLLPEPPVGMLKTIFSIGFILFVYMYPIIHGRICLWMILFAAHFIKVAKRKNSFDMAAAVVN